jgi:hypothetical protein
MPKIIYPGGGSGGGTSITVQDEGVNVVTNVSILNFVGADVSAQSGGGTTAVIYIPTPTFASHFNTTDGTTTGTVGESFTLGSRTNAFIPAPTSEGNPFETGGWAGTNNRSAVDVSPVTFSTGGLITAMENSTFLVVVADGDGTTMESYTTPAITGNSTNTSSSGDIVVTVTNYQADTSKFKADVSILVTAGDILATAGFEGGRYQTTITQTVTDGTGPYTYTQPNVFYDTDPSTPSIGGSATIAETGGSVLTKHLSGVEYYIRNSVFTISVTDIDNLNRNTARTSGNIQITGSEYGISTINNSPISGGTGASNFSGWTTNYNIQNVDYQNTSVAISGTNYRFRGNNANISARVRDTWANSGYTNSSNASILIDTYTSTSGDLFEAFDSENKRQQSNYTTAWDSTSALTAVSGAECKIEVVNNGLIQAGDTITLVDTGGVNRVLTAGTNFDVGGSSSTTATNISASINSNFGAQFTSAVDGYTNTIVNVTQDTLGPSGNQTNTSSRPGAITVSNFEEGANDALVMGGKLLVPNQGTLFNGSADGVIASDWTGYSPSVGGANPNYTALGFPAAFFRTIVDTTGLSRSSFQIVFTGTFVSNATTDLANSNLRIFLRKVASPTGGAIVGKTAVPMRLHGGTFGSAGAFNQGETVDGSYLREDSSSGNTVNGTFGTWKCQDGFYMEILLYNNTIKIDRFDVTFF